jgi:hypothetical protein
MTNIGILTHHELIALKSKTTRDRWQKQGYLPKPFWIRSDRHRLALYPEPVLARVVSSTSGQSAALERALKKVTAGCQRLYEIESFHPVAETAALIFPEFADAPWSLPRFLARLAEECAALEIWIDDLAEFEAELQEDGISLTSEAGRITAIEEDAYRVELASGSVRMSSSREVSPADLALDMAVVLENVTVGSIEQRFLLPAIAAEHALRKEVQAMPESLEQRFAALSQRAQRTPIAELFDIQPGSPSEQFNAGFILSLHDERRPTEEPRPTHTASWIIKDAIPA